MTMKVKMTSNVFATDGRVIRMGEEAQATKQKKGYTITTSDGRTAKNVSSFKFVAV